MRSVHGTFPEYHTSGDDLGFIHPHALLGTVRVCLDAFTVLEQDNIYINQKPFCEPKLDKYCLYESTGGAPPPAHVQALLWVLHESDGQQSLLDIAALSGLPFTELAAAAQALKDAGLLTTRAASATAGAL
jgi:aminopeptidase-like protein